MVLYAPRITAHVLAHSCYCTLVLLGSKSSIIKIGEKDRRASSTVVFANEHLPAESFHFSSL